MDLNYFLLRTDNDSQKELDTEEGANFRLVVHDRTFRRMSLSSKEPFFTS